jgi:hypothetical protein
MDEDDNSNSSSTQQTLESTKQDSDIAVRPGDLNIHHALVGTLVDSIVETRMRDDSRNGVNMEEIQRRRMQTAQDIMNSKKRVTAGLLSASGSFCVEPEVFALL